MGGAANHLLPPLGPERGQREGSLAVPPSAMHPSLQGLSPDRTGKAPWAGQRMNKKQRLPGEAGRGMERILGLTFSSPNLCGSRGTRGFAGGSAASRNIRH